MIASASISAQISIVQTSTTSTAGTVRESVLDSKQPSFVFSNGTGANQAALMWSTSQTLSAATNFDLTNLTGSIGTVTFAHVRMIYIENQATTDGYVLSVGGATTNPWNGYLNGTGATEIVGPSGCTLRTSPLLTGWAVSSGNSVLELNPGANTIPIRMVILGS